MFLLQGPSAKGVEDASSIITRGGAPREEMIPGCAGVKDRFCGCPQGNGGSDFDRFSDMAAANIDFRMRCWICL